MSLLGNLVSGVVGAGLGAAAKEFIEKQGGIQAIAAQFEQNGLGDTVKSWIGTGANLPITAEQINKVLGSSAIQPLAEKLGITPEEVSQQLAKFLPQAVDEMTPTGVADESKAA